MYPLISEYVETIKSAGDNFEELSYLRPVLGEDGLPVMTSGNFAVVFKMKDEQSRKFYAVKCFTKEQKGRAEAYRDIAKELEDVSSPYLVSIRYLEEELFVDTNQTTETKFPVLLMDWVEGKTLDKYLRENLDDKYALEMLAYRFSQLAQWLIPQPFAHGDLKPDNILVREDGTLVLVDYDGMYVPAMKGQKARELGSPDFRHPLRTEDDFDEHIDDFPLVSILLSLKAISLNPHLLEDYGTEGRLLFSEEDYIDISKCVMLMKLYPSNEADVNKLISVFTITCFEKNLHNIPLILYRINKPPITTRDALNINGVPIKVFPTKANENDFRDTWVDLNGIIYSKDCLRLLKGADVKKITINPQTMIICDDAFNSCKELNEVVASPSLKVIGKRAFQGCENLYKIILPESVECIGAYAFQGCGLYSTGPHSLEKLKVIDDGTFSGCINITHIPIIKGIKHIGHEAYADCNVDEIVLPLSLRSIKGNPFAGNPLEKIVSYSPFFQVRGGALFSSDMKTLICVFSNQERFFVPNGVEKINTFAFYGLERLRIVELPPSLKEMSCSFAWCPNLEKVIYNSFVLKEDQDNYFGCDHFKGIDVPKEYADLYLLRYNLVYTH